MRLVITTDTIGGVWTFTEELARGLLQQGCAVALVSFGRRPCAAQQSACDAMVAEWGTQFRYTASDAPLEWMQENDRAYTEAAPLLNQVIAEFEADVLHTNQFCFGALNTSIPKFVTAHSDVLSWAKHCRRTALDDSPWLRQYTSLVQQGLLGANAVIAPTAWMMHALEENFSLPTEQHVIPNGRSLSVQPSAKRKLQAVTAGRLWDEAKDLRLLDTVSSPMSLLIAGETEHESEKFNANTQSVTHIGHRTQEDLHHLFSESAIYICTSIYEPFGLAPLEAALCGCAILARDIPSLREVWDDNAIYFADAETLSQRLQQLASDPVALGTAQQRAQQHANRYTRERMIKAYLNLFTSHHARSKESVCVA